MTSREIQSALVGYGTNCLWSPLRVLASTNIVGVCGWEADLLVVHKSGWAWEVEIKVSVADFRREFVKKTEKHRSLQRGWSQGYQRTNQTVVRKFFFAMPKGIYEKVSGEIPEWCGVIVVDDADRDRWGRLRPTILRQGKQLPSRQFTDADRITLLTSVYHRSWRAVNDEQGAAA